MQPRLVPCRIVFWLLIATVGSAVSCRKTGNPRDGGSGALQPVNVVLVTIDTLRADRVGCYGSTVETPNLDRLSQRGVLFEDAIAQAPLTAPSHASMMTGLYPPAHGVRDTGNFVLAPAHQTLATLLQGAGWDTAAFVGASVLKKRFGFANGFSLYDDAMPPGEGGAGSPERGAAVVVDRAIAWLGSQSGKPFFLWVHLFDPHHPYDPPPPFRTKYEGRPYDGEVAYTDRELGRLFAVLDKKSPDKTLIAVLSDHGESFGEHGEYAHGVFLYETTLRIPFVLAGPGVPPGGRVKGLARTVDLLPTLLELLGGKAPRGVQGASLVSAFSGQSPPAHSYVETLFPRINMGWAELRGVRTSRWKYIRAPKPELYDLAKDPAERTNVIAAHPEETRELEKILAGAAGGNEEVKPVAVDARTYEQLKSLGYLGGSSPGKIALTGQGADPKDRIETMKLLHLAAYSEPPPPAEQRIAMLRRALGQDPLNPSLYSHLGDLLRRAGRPGEEVALYQEGANRGIRSAWLYSRLGALLLRQGKKPEAIAALEGAAQANPSDHNSLQNLAVAYRETGRIADAERVLHAILKSGEEYAPAYNELGMAAYQRGDTAAALGYFENAARLDATYQLNLGRMYKLSGDNVRARSAFEALLAATAEKPEHRRLAGQAKQELAGLP